MTVVPIALIQMRSGIDPARNLNDAEALVREAAARGARFVATPETTHLVQRDAGALPALLRPMRTDPAMGRFAELAAELKLDLLIGSMAFAEPDGRAVNRSVLFAPTGEVKATYDKIHMFDVSLGAGEQYRESDTYQPGGQAVLAEAAGFQLGLTICYDVRFAALYRRLAQAGAVAMTVPSAFTRPTGRAHWEVLLRARAIETGSFIFAPAQGGLHEDGRKTWGHSMVVGPWGDVIAALDHDDPAVLYAEVSPADALKARSRIPALKGDRDFLGP